jgi:lysophospholipase L1-like esterase
VSDSPTLSEPPRCGSRRFTWQADRQTLNAWIRAPGNFDAVIDFDAVMRDPAQPDRLKPALDSGDHLHPSLAGYRAMAEAVPLSLFKP